ncbi:unnamed protein product [Camellia sinensis]
MPVLKLCVLRITYYEPWFKYTKGYFRGYLIPKGWKVMPLFRNIHHNPEFFPDPKHFDPSRFEVAAQSNTFILFGNGVHACPGNELAELEMLIVVHHLVIKFRYRQWWVNKRGLSMVHFLSLSKDYQPSSGKKCSTTRSDVFGIN